MVPALILLFYFHKRDAYPEPGRILLGTFLWGAASCVPAVMLAWPMDALIKASGLSGGLLGGFLSAFLAAAIPEELAKMGVVRFYAMRKSAFDEPMDGIVYGATAALGFAALENVLYVSDGGLGVAVLRAVTAVPGHALYGAVMGYFLGQHRFATEGRGSLLWKAVSIPILMHGIYDWPLLAMPGGMVLVWMVPLVLTWGWIFIRRKIAALRAEQQRQGAPAALVTAEGSVAKAPVRKWPAYLMVVLGSGLLVWLGILVLVLLYALWEKSTAGHDRGSVMLGLGLFSIPGWAGLWLFVAGIRRLNRLEAQAKSGA